MSHIKFIDNQIISIMDIIQNIKDPYSDADLYIRLLNTFVQLQDEKRKELIHAKYAHQKQKTQNL